MAALERHTKRAKDTLGWLYTATVRARKRVPYAVSMQKAVLSGKQCKAVQIVQLLNMDIAHGVKTPEEAEQFGLALAATARSEWAAAHPDQHTAQLSVREAHLLEERCEGQCDEAEAAMAHEPTFSTYTRYLSASAALSAARRELDRAVRRAAVTV